MSVVGVDFGATNAVIAAAGRGGVDVILNGNSNRLNPCAVGFSESRSMGEAAMSKASSNYKNTITNIKRLVGLEFEDPRAQAEMKLVNFTCVPIKREAGGPDSIGVKVNFNNEETVIAIEAVAGMMVRHMGQIAAASAAASSSSFMDDKNAEESFFPRDWVIAIPGYYNDAQRRAFLAGCEVVGISGCQRLMHENTATALAYGIFKDIKKEFKKDEPTNVMFIDMGATAYSVSIVAFQESKLIIKSTFYDADLGGRDFDKLIAESIAEQFEAKYKGKLSGKPLDRPKTRLKIFTAAEKAKKTLSPQGVKEARVNMECLMDDLDFGCSIKADEYEKMCQPLLDRLAGPLQKALEEAELKPEDLSSVEIVGGSTRIGCVKRTLSSLLGGKSLSMTLNADEAVARGAALQSAILSPRFKVLPYEIQEYEGYPIRISWDEDATNESEQGVEVDTEGSDLPTNSVIMFDRGLNFPIVRRVTLKKKSDFTVSAGYDETATTFNLPETTNKEIAQFAIKVPAGDEKKIRVNVKQDIHGIISLSSAQMVEEVDEEEPPKKEGEGENKEEEAKEGEKKEGEEKEGENKEGEKKEEEPKKKKKLKKTNLDFTTTRPLEWTKAEIDKAYEAEVAMSNSDRIHKETADMRNELESYIYDMRDKIISESQLAPYGTEDEKTALSTALETNENWLYEDGFDATKSVYAEKLEALKKLGSPIEFRQSEASARPNAVSALQRNIEKYKTWLNESQGDEKFAHITDEERQTCHTKCDEVSSWMYDMLDKQGSLAQNVDPVVTAAEFSAKSTELTNVCSPVKHKVAPKPKKKEEKKEEKPAEKKEEEAPATSDTPVSEEDAGDSEEKKASDEPEPMETEATDEKPQESEGQSMDVEMSVD